MSILSATTKISTANQPDLSPAAHKLFTDAMAYMLANAEKFDMHTWCDADAACGTSFCFGGIILTLAGYTTDRHNNFYRPNDREQLFPLNPSSELEDLLGALSVYPLFLSSHWPYKYREEYRIAGTGSQKAAVAADRFNYFLETGI